MRFINLLFVSFSLIGCITSEMGFVNYQRVGNAYTTTPQVQKYDEIGAIQTSGVGYLWDSCDDICYDTVVELKKIAQAHGGNAVVNIFYKGKKLPQKVPVCHTNWFWGVFYGVGMLTPWVKSCHVSGTATLIKERTTSATAQ